MSKTDTTDYRWVKLLGFKGGMRYFRDMNTDRVAAADNSGRYPENTDDGVLWLNLDDAVTIELGSREYSRVTVPVKSERGSGKGYYCGEEVSHLGQFLPMWTSLGGKVELRGEVNAEVLQLLLDNVTRPLQKKCAKCDHFLPPGMVSGCHLIKVNGAEVPCFGPDAVAKATGEDQPTHADGTIDRGWKSTAGEQAVALAEAGKPIRDAVTGQCTTCGHHAYHTKDCPFEAGAGTRPAPTLLPLPLDVRDLALVRAALVAYERVVQRAVGMTEGDRKQELAPVEDLRRRLGRAQEGIEAAIIASVTPAVR